MQIDNLISPTNLAAHKRHESAITRDFSTNFGSDENIRANLILFVSPAGYGKSTALSQLNTQLLTAGWLTCWINLNEDSNDLKRFVSSLLEATAQAIPGFGDTLLTQIASEHSISAAALGHAFVKLHNETARPLTIFLDDYHFLSNRHVHTFVKTILEHAGDQLKLAIASRSEPPLGLGELRVHGKVLEIGRDELSLSIAETKEFAERQGIKTLNDIQLSRLHDKTEGWAAGLQLFCLAARNNHDNDALLESLTGRDRNIADYLADTVLAALPDTVREFLLLTSPLEQFNAELCKLVVPNFPGQAWLEEIEAMGLFLVPLDRERHWYRYHHLFGDFLLTRLKRNYPDKLTEIRKRVALWYGTRGEEMEAIKYALKGRDFDYAAEKIAAYALELVQMRGAHNIFLRWIEVLPDIYLNQWPEIRIGLAWSLTFTRDHNRAQAEIDRLLELAPSDRSSGISNDEIEQACEMIRCVIDGLSDRYEECIERAEKWLRRWPDASEFNKGTVGNSFSYACTSTFEFDRGLAEVSKARAAFERCNSPYGIGWARAIEGMLLISTGAYGKAQAVLEKGLAQRPEDIRQLSQDRSILALLLSEILYEKNDLTGARQQLEFGWSAMQEIGSLEFILTGYTISAKLISAQGDEIAAMSLLEEGRQLGLLHQMPRLVRGLTLEALTMLLRAGQMEQAETYAQNCGFYDTPDAQGTILETLENRAWVRLHLARGNHSEALTLLNPMIDSFRETGRSRLYMTGLSLKAAALLMSGAKNEALRYIERALELGSAEGAVRRFLDDAEFLTPVLSLYLAKRTNSTTRYFGHVPDDYMAVLANAFDIAKANVAPPLEEYELLAKLTKKETRLLHLIEEGLTNKQIAETLFISEKTVKWHLHNVFGKLNVRNRTGAVAVARKMSLL